MNKVIIRPRRKPALTAAAALTIITLFSIWLYNQAKEDSASNMAAALICISAAMLVSVLMGMLRTRLVLSEEGITSINSAFAPERRYPWKDIKCCRKAGMNYNLYTKANQWIGAVDQRNRQTKLFLKVLDTRKIRIINEKETES